MITIATLLWEPNANTRDFSSMYSPIWVDRLYRGFARNLSRPFRFVCFTDIPRDFAEPVETVWIESQSPNYSTCIEPYKLDAPMVLVGLDTVVCGPCDDLADYCLSAELPAYPLDPYRKRWRGRQICNGVALVPGGLAARMYGAHKGENDMEWCAANPHAVIDELFPGRVISYKAQAKREGIDGASIVYFHGAEKMHEARTQRAAPWIADHWR